MGGAFFAQVAQKSLMFLWRKGEKSRCVSGVYLRNLPEVLYLIKMFYGKETLV